MSYQLQEDQVLTGSLNLLPASSQIPPDDAVALENWRVDQQSVLRSRLAETLLTALPSAAHTLSTRDANRYAGVGAALYRDGASIASGFDGARLGMANFLGFCYVMNQALRGRDDGSTWQTWGLDTPATAPTVTLGDGGSLALNTTYIYYVTFIDALGEESNPTPGVAVTPTVEATQWAGIDHPTAPAWATHWRCYRTGNTLGGAYSVTVDPIPIATARCEDSGGVITEGVVTGDFTDVGLERTGIQMPTDNDPPPAASGLTGPYYDRLLAWRGGTGKRNWLWWSKQLQPWAWPGADLDEGNHVPVGDDGEDIETVVIRARQARVYKSASIWRLLGDPEDPNGSLDLTNPEIGLLGEAAIASRGDLDYFQATEGIYVYNGYTAKKVSDKLDPLFKGDPIVTVGAQFHAMDLSLAARKKATLAIVNGRLYFSYVPVGSSEASAGLVCDLDTGRWYSDDRGWPAIYYEGQGGALLGSNGTGLYKLEQPQSAVIDVVYQSGYRDQQKRDHQKTYADLVVEHSQAEGADCSLVAHAYYDDGLANESLGGLRIASGTPAASGRVRTVLAIGGDDKRGHMARNCAIRIEGGATSPAAIYSISLHYYLEARDALTFDSDEQHLSYQGAKRCDLLELDIDASGAVAWAFLTDIPGGAMVQRDSASIDATTGRQSVQVPLADFEGRLVRLVLTATLPFRLYGARVRYRKIGLLIDGTRGETYATLEQRAA